MVVVCPPWEDGQEPMKAVKHPLVLLLRGMLMMVVVFSLAACGDEEAEPTSVEDEEAPPAQSPAANNPVPEGAEGADIQIRDGEIEADDLSFQVEENVVLTVGNGDDQAYRFQIDGLTEPQDLPANETITIEFNSSVADSYTGQLLAEDDSVLSEVTVEIQSASGA
jgi:hypothetical protein